MTEFVLFCFVFIINNKLFVCLFYCSSGKSRDEQGASSDSAGTGGETSGSGKRVLNDQGIDLCFFMCD